MPLSAEILVVAGARPQFVKAAPLLQALEQTGLPASLLHTGQHYDPGMSRVFFDALGIPEPRWRLHCGGGSHGAMTGTMLLEIEKILMEHRPGMVMVMGDTNTTLAGALAAAKLHIPVAHVEAGLRSGNRLMPEELNRICTDHLSDLLFCSSETGRAQLAGEGITRGVHVCGDVMADVLFSTIDRIRKNPPPLPAALSGGPWALMTLHRAENTGDPARLRAIFDGIAASGLPVLFPVHPRTRSAMDQAGITPPPLVQCLPAAGYFELVALLDACHFVLTDSGGLQKEAYWLEKPCITLRGETEWTELTATGWSLLAGAGSAAITAAMASPPRGPSRPVLYGDGHAAIRIAAAIREFIASR